MSFLGGGSQARRFVLIACVAVVSVITSGCASSIEVLQTAEATPRAVATVAPAEHALSILAIDFDPPLTEIGALVESGVTLLVAVENQGLSTEEDVVVTARLVDISSRGVERDLLIERALVRAIEPGELKVVRFDQVSGLPLRESYALIIEVPAVLGETSTADNFRRYDIIIHADE